MEAHVGGALADRLVIYLAAVVSAMFVGGYVLLISSRRKASRVRKNPNTITGH